MIREKLGDGDVTVCPKPIGRGLQIQMILGRDGRDEVVILEDSWMYE